MAINMNVLLYVWFAFGNNAAQALRIIMSKQAGELHTCGLVEKAKNYYLSIYSQIVGLFIFITVTFRFGETWKLKVHYWFHIVALQVCLCAHVTCNTFYFHLRHQCYDYWHNRVQQDNQQDSWKARQKYPSH